MKNRFVVACFILAYTLILPVFSFGSDEQGRPNAAAPDNSYEFAPVLDGAQIVHDFVVLNKGNAALEIEKVETG